MMRGRTTHTCRLVPLPAKVVEDLVPGNRPQPPTKRVTRAVVSEIGKMLGDRASNFLKHIGPVGRLQPGTTAQRQHNPPV
jgi:hypothetical protein